MDRRCPILADPQSAEAVQPGQRPLDDPADLAQAAAMLRPAAGERRPAPSPTQPAAIRLRVEAAVAVKPPGPASRPAGLAPHRRDRIDQPDQRHDIRDVRRRGRRHQRDPSPVGDDRVLAALLAAIDGAGAGPTPSAAGPREAAVDDGPVPVDPVGALHLGQQHLVQPPPDTGPIPVAEPSPAGHAAAAAHLAGQVLPVDAGLQDEEDAGEALAVVDRLASGVAEAAGLGRGQQRPDVLPQFIGDEWLGHGDPPSITLSTSEGTPRIVILLGTLSPDVAYPGPPETHQHPQVDSRPSRSSTG